MEKKNTAKLIQHKRQQRDKLIELLIWGLIGAALSVGFMLAVLLYCRDGGAILKEVRKMKRVPTLMYEAEFQEYLDRQKKAVEEMKKDGVDYMSRVCRLWGRVTATAGEENELCFTASQLDQIFDLAK